MSNESFWEISNYLTNYTVAETAYRLYGLYLNSADMTVLLQVQRLYNL